MPGDSRRKTLQADFNSLLQQVLCLQAMEIPVIATAENGVSNDLFVMEIMLQVSAFLLQTLR